MVEGAGLKSIGDLLQSPKKIVGVETETEKQIIATDGKNMIEGLALPESVVETDFGDDIFPAVPENFTGRNGVKTVIKRED